MKCPSHDIIRSFVIGSLDEDQFSQVSSHIDFCETCQQTVDEIDGSPKVLDVAVELSDDFSRQDSSVVSALSRIEADGPAWKNTQREFSNAVPESIGQFQIIEPIGRGGMGTVYKAIHKRLRKTVAIKILPIDLVDNEQSRVRFEREMEAIGPLEHPNIVQAFDADQRDGFFYIAMERINGPNISELIRSGIEMSIADCCEIARQTANGLQYVCDNGLVHRDIKPSNLMVTARGRSNDSETSETSLQTGSSRIDSSSEFLPIVKILDLGLALLRVHDGESITSDEQLMGTIDYMAPEQANDVHSVDIRADIYGLGATLVKMLTGKSPLQFGEHQSNIKKIDALLNGPSISIRKMRSDIPPQLASVIDRMLCRSPASRFETPDEVASALAPFCENADLAGLLDAASPNEFGSNDSSQMASQDFRIARRILRIGWLLERLLPSRFVSWRHSFHRIGQKHRHPNQSVKHRLGIRSRNLNSSQFFVIMKVATITLESVIVFRLMVMSL